jgi:tellurite resistance protein
MDITEKHSLKDYPEQEKKAYLAAVASMATPEDTASDEEVAFLEDLCEDAELTEQDKQEVINEAKSPTNNGFESYLGLLKNSELKYSFVVDVISFAKADGYYSEEEKERILLMTNKLGISREQYDALHEYVDKAESTQDEDASQVGFLEKTGLKQKLENSNIPIKGLLTGLVGSMLMKGAMGRNRRGGMLGSLLGGGGIQRRGGGLSSVIGMLSGKRGYSRSGGLLGRLLKKS